MDGVESGSAVPRSSRRAVTVSVVMACLALVAVVAGVGAATGGSPVAVASSPSVTVSPAPVAVPHPVSKPGKPCAGETSECFNSCTMGINGDFPESDPRRAVPGPCDLSARTVLPRKRFLDQELSPLADPPGMSCDDGSSGWRYWRVTVLVRESDGLEVPDSRVELESCMPPAPHQLSGDVAGELPGMYREAASRA